METKIVYSRFKIYLAAAIFFIAAIGFLSSYATAYYPSPEERIQKEKNTFNYHDGAKRHVEHLLTELHFQKLEHEKGSIKDLHYHKGAIAELEHLIEYLQQERWNHHQDQKESAHKRANEIRDKELGKK